MNASHRLILVASLLGVSGHAATASQQPERAARALTDTVIPLAERNATGVSPRGGVSDFRGLLETFEGYPVGVSLNNLSFPPANSFGPPGFVWPNTIVRGPANPGIFSAVDLSGAPIGGNNTRALRLVTPNPPADPGSFALGFWLRWDSPPIGPSQDANARAAADHSLSTIDQLYTFETVSVNAGFIASRVLWGGQCVDENPGDCEASGLPLGLIPTFHYLSLDPFSFLAPRFIEAKHCTDYRGNAIPGCTPPPGAQIGDPVAPPIGSWFTLATEITLDANVLTLVDLHDGAGESLVGSTPVLTVGNFNRVGWNTSYEAAGVALLVDNLDVGGVFAQSLSPPALECPSYLDDLEWLNTGALLGQNARWFAALSSGVTVVNAGAPQGQTLQQTNTLANNLYQLSARTTLPTTYANASSPWSLCVDASTGAGDTVRALAIHSPNAAVAGGLVTRVFLGARNPITGDFDDSIFVQINPDFDPFDDAPVVGVDIVSTGVQWPADDQFREVCVTVAFDNSLTLAVDGVTVYNGLAFNSSANSFQFETANDAAGAGSRLRIDTIALECAALPQVVLPEFTLPYCDDFEWGVEGLRPSQHNAIATGDPPPSQRYSENPYVVIADTGDDLAVAMPNVFRDTAHTSPPDINANEAFIFQQFISRVPGVEVSFTTGWRVDAQFTLSDFTTSRGWSPLMNNPAGASYFVAGYAWYSAPDDRFYLFGAQSASAAPGAPLATVVGPTRAALGIVAGEPFAASWRYNLAAGTIDWSINAQHIGSTFPIVVMNPVTNQPLVVRNLDAVVIWGGDDNTAPAEPLSTLFLHSLCVASVPRCFGDTNGDGVINFADLNAVLGDFGMASSDPILPGDTNGDGVVNFFDLNIVLSGFGNNCD